MLVIKKLLAMLIIAAGFIAPYILLWQFPPITSSHWLDALIYFFVFHVITLYLAQKFVLAENALFDIVADVYDGMILAAIVASICVLLAPLWLIFGIGVLWFAT